MQYLKILIICSIYFCSKNAVAQINNTPAIGMWRQHLPFTQALDIVATPTSIFAATPYGLCSINTTTNEVGTFTKINGLSETSVTKITYNNTVNNIIIAYNNSNIDLLNANGNITNINDIKRKNITADKTIYNFYNNNNLLYISTGFGIVVIDLLRNETKDTWVLGALGNYEKVNNITLFNNSFYAATANGVRVINANAAAIANGNNWGRLAGFQTQNIKNIISFGSSILIQRNDTLFKHNGTTTTFFYADGFSINNISIANNQVILSQENFSGQSKISILNANGMLQNTIARPGVISAPQQALMVNNTLYVADFFNFISTFNNTNFIKQYSITGPVSTIQGQIIYANNTMYCASGGVNNLWQYTYQGTGYYSFSNNTWQVTNRGNTPLLDTVFDIHTLAYNTTTNTLYAGSYGGGLVAANPTTNTKILLKQNKLLPALGDPTSYRVGGLAIDAQGNTWVANYGGVQSLACIQPNGNILRFMHPYIFFDNALGSIVIDQNNNKWITVPKGGGVLCYNSGNNLNSPTDDTWKLYRAGTTQGNLTDNEITSIAIDKQNSIWVGTINGINIIPCADQVFTPSSCQAIQPIVKIGNFAGVLLQNQNIQSIAIDGANRKWIATQNGVFLVTADGDKVIQQFTETNSPLPNNNVKTIGINGQTGEVFMGTIQGLVSYMGNATEANDAFSNVLVYPNPVPKNYNGTIAIKGLAANSIVKIINPYGVLVQQGIANGGTYSFTPQNYNGQPIATGIYMVLMRNANGTEKAVAKIAIIK